MPSNIYNYCTDSGAHVTEPPDQWLLVGPSDEDPWVVNYNSWLLKGILEDLEPVADIYDAEGPGVQVNRITPYGATEKISPIGDDGIYLADWLPAAITLKATDGRTIVVDVGTSPGVGHGWTWGGDGYLAITLTKGVKGLRTAKDTTSGLRYGYDNTAYPSFRYPFSPRNGGWAVTNPLEGYYFPNSVAHADRAALGGTGVGPYTVAARAPLIIPHDTTRGSAVAFTVKGLYVGKLHLAGSATTTSVSLKARDRTTSAITTVFEVTSTSTTAADLSDTSTGVPDMDTENFEYYFEWSVANASLLDGAYVGYVYLDIEKRAVE
jgi:hypothetical protein